MFASMLQKWLIWTQVAKISIEMDRIPCDEKQHL
jgi:hypothetical protein